MTVSVLSISARGEREIAVTFEIRNGELAQKECFLLSASVFADLRLAVGECDRDTFDAVSDAAELYRATKKGLSLLGYGASSQKALYRKLVLKGFSKDIAQRATLELSESGYINENSDAVREAERGVSKLWGKKRIIAHLRSKGYPDEAIKEAVYSLEDSGIDFAQLCAERLERDIDSLPRDPKEMQKLVASLMRYGFSGGEIKKAIKAFHG